MQIGNFTFGDPEPINGRQQIWGPGSIFTDFDGYYEPPVPMPVLDNLSRANATHNRCINFKRNQVNICFQPNPLIPEKHLSRAATDFFTFGNCYFQGFFNRFGHLLRLEHLPSLNMRIGEDGKYKMLVPEASTEDIEFQPGEVFHVMQYDTGQDIYGVPDWLGGLQDIYLNSEATLFRRRYYLNGSHMGYILYTTDANMDADVEEAIRKAVESGKGIGNFKNLFINSPNGNEKGVQIIPVGDTSQKDEFQKVKNLSADDIIVAHGVPPILAGMKPENTSGFGDIEKIESVYRRMEMPALVQPFEELNEKLPEHGHFKFDFYASAAPENSQ